MRHHRWVAPNLGRFIDWLLEQAEGLFVVALLNERRGVDCGARPIYNPACTSTLPLTMDSLGECVPGGRKRMGIKETRKLVRLCPFRVVVVVGFGAARWCAVAPKLRLSW